MMKITVTERGQAFMNELLYHQKFNPDKSIYINKAPKNIAYQQLKDYGVKERTLYKFARNITPTKFYTDEFNGIPKSIQIKQPKISKNVNSNISSFPSEIQFALSKKASSIAPLEKKIKFRKQYIKGMINRLNIFNLIQSIKKMPLHVLSVEPLSPLEKKYERVQNLHNSFLEKYNKRMTLIQAKYSSSINHELNSKPERNINDLKTKINFYFIDKMKNEREKLIKEKLKKLHDIKYKSKWDYLNIDNQFRNTNFLYKSSSLG